MFEIFLTKQLICRNISLFLFKFYTYRLKIIFCFEYLWRINKMLRDHAIFLVESIYNIKKLFSKYDSVVTYFHNTHCFLKKSKYLSYQIIVCDD